MCSDVVIRAQGLGKVYRLFDRPQDRLREALFRRGSLGRDFWALSDLDLEVRRGETVGVVGRNGSGKSTLLQLVCGTTQPSAGELEVHGRVAAMLELGAGFNPEFTGRENVYLSAAVLGLSEKEIAARFSQIAAFAEIGDFIDQPVRQYSSGMYARLAFAVCAHVDADIMVIDEVLSVGDAGFQQRCMRFLHGFRQRGTLLFVSHDEAAVLSLCDHAIWLNEGRIWAAGASKDVCAHYRAMVAQGDNYAGTFQATPVGGAAAKSAAGALKPFDFDLDPAWTRGAAPIIESATLSHPDGRKADAADGDSEVVLRIEARATRALEAPVLAFVLRNRLGQVILRDNTSGLPGVPGWVEPRQRFGATFRFRLPHLPTGDYSIEPWLFEPSFKEPVDG
ncbi:MAG: ABC transporter ATP-binding protein, partial [Stellaceae bacterium]